MVVEREGGEREGRIGGEERGKAGRLKKEAGWSRDRSDIVRGRKSVGCEGNVHVLARKEDIGKR
jgi:hypothetical protein